MNKSKLIEKLGLAYPHLYRRDVRYVVDVVFEEITNQLSAHGKVELRGFGSFGVKKRKPRLGRNPKTGKTLPVKEKHIPFFKISKALVEKLNHDESKSSLLRT